MSVPRRGIRRPGIKVYCAGELPRACRTIWHGVPTTTAAHAILDLAAVVTSDEVFARTLHEAEVQDWVTHDQLRAELDRHPTHPGRPRLERELGWGPTPTRCPPEDRLVEILRRNGFTGFETNARIPGLPRWIEVDVLFAAHRVVIEVDGDRYHKTRYRRRRDARKQAIIEAAGLRVIRLVPDDCRAGEREPRRDCTVLRSNAIPNQDSRYADSAVRTIRSSSSVASSSRSLTTTCPNSGCASSSRSAVRIRSSTWSAESVPRPTSRVRSASWDGGEMNTAIASGIAWRTCRAPWTSISKTIGTPAASRFSISDRSVP